MTRSRKLLVGALLQGVLLVASGCGNEAAYKRGYNRGLREGYWRGTQTFVEEGLPTVGAVGIGIALVFVSVGTTAACVVVGRITYEAVVPEALRVIDGLVEQKENVIEELRLGREAKRMLSELEARDKEELRLREHRAKSMLQQIEDRGRGKLLNGGLLTNLTIFGNELLLADQRAATAEVLKRAKRREREVKGVVRSRDLPTGVRRRLLGLCWPGGEQHQKGKNDG